MTTEDDFQKQLDANPKEWQTRLVFADWLQERGDPRAEGYRALGVLRLLPLTSGTAVRDATARQARLLLPLTSKTVPHSAWFASKARWDGSSNALPEDWFVALAAHLELTEDHGSFLPPVETCSRREAEDAAALAFTKLPDERRAELLAIRPADEPVEAGASVEETSSLR